MHGIVFLPASNIENLNAISFEQTLDLTRGDHHALVLLPGTTNAFKDLLRIEAVISKANLRERLIGPESTTCAAANVVVSK
jgi:hypothetical protein